MQLRRLPNSEKKNMPNKARYRIVLDSVILVSAFVTENGLAAQLLDKLVEKAELYITEEILQETRRVLLEKDHLRSRFSYSDTNVERFIEALRTKCVVVEPLPDLRVIERDPKDDIITACAVAAQADYIVSRDLDLLDLKEYQDIRIVSPEDFMHHLRGVY
jgi:putative PIN family toxin of toxin-antitoxin system